MYFACKGVCGQATEEDDYAHVSLKALRTALIEDESVARFRSENVRKPMVVAHCEGEVLCRTCISCDGAWPDMHPVQKHCVLQV